jgi:purine-binding chemotaxis protein CheW
MSRWLILRVGERSCALPVAAVVETMRPLPVDVLPGALPAVLGIAVVRGEALPVLDARLVLDVAAAAPPARFVTVRANGRHLALAVDEVVGLAALDEAAGNLAPLLAPDEPRAVTGVATRAGRPLLLLDALRLLPPDVWRRVEERQAAPRPEEPSDG